jgi:hypothetical protein
MKRIRAEMNCDECGTDFTVIVPCDSNNEGCPTIFETVLNSSDCAQRANSHTIEEWGSHEGQHFGPCCWEEKSEELFIEDIKAGRVTEQQLVDWDMIDEYRQHVPRKVVVS